MPVDDRNRPVSLLRIVRAIRRKWYICLACILITPAVIYAVTSREDKRYTASATLLFESSDLDQGLVSNASDVTQDPARLAATNTALAGLDVVRQRTKAALEGSFGDIPIDVKVAQSPSTNLATVSATTAAPNTAAGVATTFAQQFIAFRSETAAQSIRRAIALLGARIAALSASDAAGGQGAELRLRLEQLQNLAAVQTGDVQLVQVARRPVSPSAPKPKRDAGLGLLLGILLGVVFAVVADRFDRRLRDPAEIETLVGRPTLGMIPRSKAIAGQGNGSELSPTDAEAFRLLRSEIRYFKGSRAACVLLTSSMAGEGKSTIAWNLALSVAEAGGKVLLIEADLRRPVLAGRYESESQTRPGLSALLSEQSGFDDVLRTFGREGAHSIDVIYAGAKPPNPSDLLQSENMRLLLTAARASYDFVLLDSAPLTLVSDSAPLMEQVDGVLVVTRQGETERDALRLLLRRLEHLGGTVLGVVINATATRGQYAAHGYYDLPQAGTMRA